MAVADIWTRVVEWVMRAEAGVSMSVVVGEEKQEESMLLTLVLAGEEKPEESMLSTPEEMGEDVRQEAERLAKVVVRVREK